MRTSRRWAWLVAFAATIAALVLGVGTDEVLAPVPHASGESGSSATFVPPSRPAIVKRELSIGVEHSYAAQMDHAVRPPKGETFTVRVEGEWSIAVIAITETGTLLRAELHQGVRSIVRQGGAIPVASTGLELPYYVTLGPDGRVIALSFDKRADDAARAALASLTAISQVVGLDAGERAWTTEERDTLGPYRASYSRSDWTLAKAKTAYTLTSVEAAISASNTSIQLRSDGWPASIDGQESIVIALQEAKMTDDAKYKLTHVRRRIGVPIGPVPPGFDVVALDAINASARATADEDARLLAGASLDDLMRDMRAAGDDLHASTKAFLRMAVLFRLDPEAARAGAQAVLDGLDGKIGGAVIGALGRAGTPEAQAALGDVLEADKADGTMRQHAAIAMGLTKQPTPDTVAQLAKTSEGTGPLADAALLAMGTTANNGAPNDPDTAARTVEELLHRLAVATTDDERVRLLRAIGNTGDLRILIALEAAFTSRNSVVRATAIEAMRLVPSPRVDSWLVRALSDPSPEVRTTAVMAGTHRADVTQLVPALTLAARGDNDVGVRFAILTLASGRMSIPAMRALVEWAAANDKDSRLRAAAKQALQPQPT